MSYTDICGSKLRGKLGGMLNESASEPTSSFAKKQLEKMGWKEGEGLGKEQKGIKSHIRVKQRAENEGLGQEKVKIAEASNQWWSASLNDTLLKLQLKNQQAKEKKEKKSKSKSKKRKKEKKKSEIVMRQYTDDELFEATGGARFGMRAQRRAEGKWSRTESGDDLRKLELIAKSSIEWEGRGKAKVVLSKGTGSINSSSPERISASTEHNDIPITPNVDEVSDTTAKSKKKKKEKRKKPVNDESSQDEEIRKKQKVDHGSTTKSERKKIKKEKKKK